MEKIGIIVDEGADLTDKIIQKYNITAVPINLDWPQIEGLPGENLYQRMREVEKRGMKTFGKTSQPSPKEFLDAYKKQFENFEEIVCITITSKLSGTYNSALQAKKFLPAGQQEKVFVVDSLSVSGGEGLLALKAQELIEKGVKAAEITEQLNGYWKNKIHLRVVFEDPKWIEASGRMSSTMADWVRKMSRVGIRPVIGLKEGVLKPMGIKTGAKDMAVSLFKDISHKTKNGSREDLPIKVIITHGDNLEDAQRLKEMIEKDISNSQVLFINLVNDIVGSLAGPDALALSWGEG